MSYDDQTKVIKKEIKFSKNQAILAIVAVLAFMGFRVLTLGESHDPKLKQAILTELRNELGGIHLSQMSEMYDDDYEGYVELSEERNFEDIKIFSMSVSKPLLEISSDVEAIVKVEFQLPSEDKKIVYYRANHGTFGNWSIRNETHSAAYYMNFF